MALTSQPLDPAQAEAQNELRAAAYLQRTEIERAHEALDKIAIPRKDRFNQPYDLPHRIERMQFEFTEQCSVAEHYLHQYQALKVDNHALERRRIRLEYALGAMRRANLLLDLALLSTRPLAELHFRLAQRIKQTGVRQKGVTR